jgi:HlyD family secretion protein
VRLVYKLGLFAVLLLTTIPIALANLSQDPSFFRFKWKLDQEPPVQVRLAPVARAHVARTIEAPGRVEADVEVKISSQVVGRITKLPFKEGDRVEKGKLVVQLDQVPFLADVRSGEARVKRLEASIRVSQGDLEKTKRDADRNRKLVSDRAVSLSDTVDMQTAYEKEVARQVMARAELDEAEGALAKCKDDLAHTTVEAPINGVVSQLLAKEGEVVVVGTMNTTGSVIMSISDPNTMVVRARVDENSVASVRPGQKALVHFQAGGELTVNGRVQRISPKGTKASATATSQGNDNEVAIFETIIALDPLTEAQRRRAWLGMTVSVEILVEERDGVLSIPAPSVLHRRARDLPAALVEGSGDEAHGPGVKDPGRRYHQVVFVAEDGKAHARLVKTGISDDTRVEILDGLREGEQVIAGPYRVFDKLKEGKPVGELRDDGDD